MIYIYIIVLWYIYIYILYYDIYIYIFIIISWYTYIYILYYDIYNIYIIILWYIYIFILWYIYILLYYDIYITHTFAFVLNGFFGVTFAQRQMGLEMLRSFPVFRPLLLTAFRALKDRAAKLRRTVQHQTQPKNTKKSSPISIGHWKDDWKNHLVAYFVGQVLLLA